MHASCCTAELPYSHHLNAPDCDANIFRPGEQSVKRNAVLFVCESNSSGWADRPFMHSRRFHEACKRFRTIPPRGRMFESRRRTR